MTKMKKILVVDDENGVRRSFHMILKDQFSVILAQNGKEAIDIFSSKHVDLVLLDIRLPDVDGVELLKKFKDMDPNTEVIMVTAVNSVQTAVKAIKAGACEYIIKPFDVEEVMTVINRALEKRLMVKELTYLRQELQRYHHFEKMVGNDKKMISVFEMIATVSQSDGTVLVQGESGTGKELVARAIHNRSPRKGQPFVVVNCGAIPVTLMERELFGHIKGAFTGAIYAHTGKLEIADNGTVFLDDIDSLDIKMQAKLLRVIQEKEFERLGSTKVVKVDIRFVAASNKNLKTLVETGEFRKDLFYRLNVFPINLPPLRERSGDIPQLLDYFLELQFRNTGKPRKKFSKEAVKTLTAYDWPGNVRELQNLVERLFTISKNQEIQLNDISTIHIVQNKIKNMTLKDAVTAFEKQYIDEVLEFYNRKRNKAADKLGIHRNTLLSKIKEFDLK